MPEAKRRDNEWEPAGAVSPRPWEMPHDHGQGSGGPVRQMQTDLVRRIAPWGMPGEEAAGDAIRGERLVRRLSVAGGYLALLSGYLGAAYLVLR